MLISDSRHCLKVNFRFSEKKVCGPKARLFVMFKEREWGFPTHKLSVFQFPNRGSSLCHFRTIDARLATVYARSS